METENNGLNISKEQMEADIAVIIKKSQKNEKLAWVRKHKKMQKFLEELTPLEEQILELITKKQPILDEIMELRQIMVKDCIHSVDNLIHHGSYIECKFCDTKIRINRHL